MNVLHIDQLPRQLLEDYRDRPIFFEKLSGNHGDRLIRMGSELMFDRAGVCFASSPAEAEAIVIVGGAAMTDLWGGGFQILREYNTTYPGTPLIVLPSTYYFEETNFSDLFRSRKAPAFLYCRERLSFERLAAIDFPSDVRVGLGSDMAFELKDSKFIHDLKISGREKYLLIVERRDAESTTGLQQRPLGPSFTRLVPRRIRSAARWPLIRYWQMRSWVQTSFVHTAKEQVAQFYPDAANLPTIAADISVPHYCSFQRFCRLVADAAVIVTMRLHVGIFAAMLGKPTILAATARMSKMKSVYDYSLCDFSNVHFLAQ